MIDNRLIVRVLLSDGQAPYRTDCPIQGIMKILDTDYLRVFPRRNDAIKRVGFRTFTGLRSRRFGPRPARLARLFFRGREIVNLTAHLRHLDRQPFVHRA